MASKKPYRIWSDEEKAKLRRLLEQEWDSYAELAEEFPDRNVHSVKGEIRTLGLKLRRRSKTSDILRKLQKEALVEVDERTKRELVEKGYLIREFEGKVQLRTTPPPGRTVKIYEIVPELPPRFKIGAISDTHYGSVWCAKDKIKELCDRLEDEGVALIIHCGDWVDGILRKEDIQYQDAIGADRQIQAVAEHFPYPKTKVVGIGGSHDVSYLRKFGLDVLRLLQHHRPDIEFLGYHEARIELLENVMLGIMHPRGGAAYARTYRLQKIVEQLGESRPEILLLGHFHYSAYLFYLGTHAFHVPCCQFQTLHLRERALLPTIGALVLQFDFSPGYLKELKWKMLM